MCVSISCGAQIYFNLAFIFHPTSAAMKSPSFLLLILCSVFLAKAVCVSQWRVGIFMLHLSVCSISYRAAVVGLAFRFHCWGELHNPCTHCLESMGLMLCWIAPGVLSDTGAKWMYNVTAPKRQGSGTRFGPGPKPAEASEKYGTDLNGVWIRP